LQPTWWVVSTVFMLKYKPLPGKQYTRRNIIGQCSAVFSACSIVCCIMLPVNVWTSMPTAGCVESLSGVVVASLGTQVFQVLVIYTCAYMLIVGWMKLWLFMYCFIAEHLSQRTMLHKSYNCYVYIPTWARELFPNTAHIMTTMSMWPMCFSTFNVQSNLLFNNPKSVFTRSLWRANCHRYN